MSRCGHLLLSENVQGKLTEWVPHLHQQEYHNRLTTLNLPTLRERRLRRDLIQCYGFLSNTFSVDLPPPHPPERRRERLPQPEAS
ncbi:hypothetical protein JTB14_005942 [Gonioctena quinquepunctata]|nr:hypothetical protein JTB14_005942 [Gonioctena quinquepunctata]